MEVLVGPVGIIMQEGLGVKPPGVLWNLQKEKGRQVYAFQRS